MGGVVRLLAETDRCFVRTIELDVGLAGVGLRKSFAWLWLAGGGHGARREKTDTQPTHNQHMTDTQPTHKQHTTRPQPAHNRHPFDSLRSLRAGTIDAGKNDRAGTGLLVGSDGWTLRVGGVCLDGSPHRWSLAQIILETILHTEHYAIMNGRKLHGNLAFPGGFFFSDLGSRRNHRVAVFDGRIQAPLVTEPDHTHASVPESYEANSRDLVAGACRFCVRRLWPRWGEADLSDGAGVFFVCAGCG